MDLPVMAQLNQLMILMLTDIKSILLLIQVNKAQQDQ